MSRINCPLPVGKVRLPTVAEFQQSQTSDRVIVPAMAESQQSQKSNSGGILAESEFRQSQNFNSDGDEAPLKPNMPEKSEIYMEA